LSERQPAGNFTLMHSLPDFVTTQPLPAPPAGWWDYDHAVLNDGALALVRIDRNLMDKKPPGHPRWWSGVRLRLSSIFGDAESGAVETQASWWPRVSRIADGRWLVAAARADEGDRNARIINTDGSGALSFAIGDHVSSIVCTPGGAIWVGYGDESAGGDSMPAGSGLAAFDAAGECRWLFDSDSYEIWDCDALSATGEDIWACTYDDFPIIRVRDGQIRSWENEIRGASALAADGDYVVLAGGYPTFQGLNNVATDDRIVLLRLDERRAVVVAELRLPAIAERDAFLCGRDGALHIVVGGSWLRLAVKDWASTVMSP